jgi:hypothetical protein
MDQPIPIADVGRVTAPAVKAILFTKHNSNISIRIIRLAKSISKRKGVKK